MIRTLAFAVTLLALVFGLVSCDSTQKQIVGKWRVQGSTDAVWDFQANGSVTTTSGGPGRYSFGDNNRLKIQTPSATFVQQIELRGDQMTWRDMNGAVTQLSRVK
jgi:hypothetical protein